MVAIPAQCPRCHSIFPFKGIATGPGVNIKNLHLKGNRTNCPVCGFHAATIADGIFSVANDAIEIISAPDATVEMLKAFAGIAKRASEGQISKEQATAEAEAVSPQFGGLLRRDPNNFLPIITILAALLAIYISHYDSLSSDISAEARHEKLMTAIMEQTHILKSMRDQKNISATAQQDTQTKPPTQAVPKGFRRSRASKTRRHVLRKRRSEFGGSRSR